MEGTTLIGIDTNVLLRFVLRDDAIQFAQARALFGSLSFRNAGYISLLVLCEFAWTLGRSSRYKRSEIANAVEQILGMAEVVVEQESAVRNALKHFRASRADFGDCCIAALASAAGCDWTATFDKQASRLPSMRLLGEARA